MLLHGVPTWSYIYRSIIPVVADAGYRVIAPDMAGFGKSDKPVDKTWHTLSNHVETFRDFISSLNLNNIMLFGQDWGSMIGLRLASDFPERFSGIIISNGGLPTGIEKIPLLFRIWKLFSIITPDIMAGCVVNFGCLRKITKSERAAYNLPFESRKSLAGPRSLPSRVPLLRNHPEAIKNRYAMERLAGWAKPFLTVFGDSDPLTRGWDRILQNRIPGSSGKDHRVLKAGHFIQEDAPLDLAEIIITFMIKYL